jgi:HSP20 family protein
MSTSVVTRKPQRPGAWFERGPWALLRQEMQDLLSRFDGEEPPLGRLAPVLDVAESDKCVEVRMDAPGLKPDDFDIQVNRNVLTISGERKEEKEDKGKTYLQLECRYGAFSRSVLLPADVNGAEAAAQYDHGVLKIVLPKSTPSAQQKIKVKG